MQLRRILWLEAGDELRLLSGIPETWMDAGKVVEVSRGGGYFGGFSISGGKVTGWAGGCSSAEPCFSCRAEKGQASSAIRDAAAEHQQWSTLVFVRRSG